MMYSKKETILSEMNDFLIGLGFEKVCIGDKKLNYFGYNNGYYRFDYWEERGAIVIEGTDNYNEAVKGLLEDCDIYYLNEPSDKIMEDFKKDIMLYYV